VEGASLSPGVPHDLWIRENILLPTGMTDTWLALDPEPYRHYGTQLGFLYNTKDRPVPLPHADSELAAARSRPSASCRGPAHDLVAFYEMLRGGGEIGGKRILQAQTVAAMTTRQRVGMYDRTFGHMIDWGLGLIINSAHHGPRVPYQYGPHASRDTFGHGGSQSSVGFCDPQRHLSAAVIFNGRPGEPAHDRRLRAVLGTLYEDLGLV
jgi:CubicO group peptidase (beta-lactamase class C family)